MEQVKTLSRTKMTHEEWLKERQKGIGGSDAAAALGISRYKSKFRLFLEKTGKVEQPEPTERMQIGIEVEEAIFQMVKKRLSDYALIHNNQFYRHNEYPWMVGNIDGDIYDPRIKEFGVLELKFVSPYMKKEWEGEEIPQEYIIQLQHYFIVTNRSWGYIAALIGNEELLIKRVERDEELCKMIIDGEKNFWLNHVEKNIPPEIDGSEDAERLLNQLYPESYPEEIQLPPTAETLIEELNELKVQKKDLEEEIRLRENQIKEMLGEFESGRVSRYQVFWKTVIQKRLDSKKLKNERPDLYEEYTKETQYRKFSIKEAK
ncbi:YqaJ viral recombinase family protein [Kosmotoga pacifica]|uniref:YqaJ viral recombinase domain-containing protein n=1 Tax=Kosmotoga pacifica TaxID=1330330 RepID=A0A0G2ZAG4_9BACT|nr:YqaJ viral recombinase family protein [Kosmotoga pacifica]AKI96569.1 hypothetical protein IX53_00615 [Kosmotoga pacifica]